MEAKIEALITVILNPPSIIKNNAPKDAAIKRIFKGRKKSTDKNIAVTIATWLPLIESR